MKTMKILHFSQILLRPLGVVCLISLPIIGISGGLLNFFQEMPQPISRSSIVEALSELETGDSQVPLIKLIEKRGVNFKVTETAEKQLRKAGAEDELVDAIKENYKQVSEPTALDKGKSSSNNKGLWAEIAKEGLGTLSESLKAKSKKTVNLYTPPAFDGRIGRFAFYNGSGSPITVGLVHPNDPSKVFYTQEVASNSNTFIGTFNIGSDWGLKVGDSKVCAVGPKEVSDWYPDKKIFNSGTGRCK